LSETIKNILRKLIKGKSIKNEEPSFGSLVLNIKIDNLTIARLSYDEDSGEFCLIYTENFEKSGIKPFHQNKVSTSYGIKTDIVYKSSTLWYAFSSRIPNPDRDDYEEALKEAGLRGNEPTLEIIGKLSNTSISKPWTFELSESNKASA
jgi:hypothetical protein